MERTARFELAPLAWKANMLPLNTMYARQTPPFEGGVRTPCTRGTLASKYGSGIQEMSLLTHGYEP